MHNTKTKQVCSRCKQLKPWSHFSRNKTTATGYQTECKVCNADRYRTRVTKALETAEGALVRVC